jgi:D-beta-D-heptose 7-phosphate kinase/D-beta-D-heptose 1-phosphate adenosyltransferase
MSNDRFLIPFVERLDSAVVACVGDIMLDHFVYGDVSRISPEAPVPIVRIQSQRAMLGGLGNVVRNLGALGCDIRVFSVTGEDGAAREISSLLEDVAGCKISLQTEPKRTTTVKVRYIANNQQLLRTDSETNEAIMAGTRGRLFREFEASIRSCSAVVLSDYGKGVLSGEGASEFIRLAREHGKPVIVDPKGTHYGRYRYATVIKPNLKELREATGFPAGDTAGQESAARKLIEDTEAEYILLTRGQEGMLLVGRDAEPIEFPALAREVFDVSGAGDTVASALAAALGSGVPVADGARLANIAAGIVVGKVGTAVVDRSEIVQEIEHLSSQRASDKILRPDEACERSAMWRRMGSRIGFLFGSFDQVSAKELEVLDDARKRCDRLVVAVQCDRAVAASGEHATMHDQRTRAYFVASLVSSDAVVISDNATVNKMLPVLQPDVLGFVEEIGLDCVWTKSWQGAVNGMIPALPNVAVN